MKPSEVVMNDNISNRDKFGFYLRARRSEIGITLREFAEKLHLSPAYISDIEKGNRYAPINYLDQVAELLRVEQEERNYLFDLAGCSHSNWPDINEYLAENPNARKAIRLARDKNMSGEEFLGLVEYLAKSSKQSSAQPTQSKERTK